MIIHCDLSNYFDDIVTGMEWFIHLSHCRVNHYNKVLSLLVIGVRIFCMSTGLILADAVEAIQGAGVGAVDVIRGVTEGRRMQNEEER